MMYPTRKKVRISNRTIGDEEPVFITFEGGATHTGLDVAKRMVQAASEGGADAVKFQTVWVEKVMSNRDVDVDYESAKGPQREPLTVLIKRRQLTHDEWRELKNYADSKNIIFFSTPDSNETIDFLVEIGAPCIKIAAGEMTDHPLIRHAAETKLPVLLDTRSTLGELEAAIETCLNAGNDQIVVIHTPSGYPTATESIRLRALDMYRRMFEYPIGFTDHSPGMDIDVAAVALGANYIEKNITMSRTAEGIEHTMAVEPSETKDFVKRIRDVERALGQTHAKIMALGEKEALKKMRRSVVLKRNGKAGEMITEEMLDYKRPGYGITPALANILIGKRLVRDIDENTLLGWDDVG